MGITHRRSNGASASVCCRPDLPHLRRARSQVAGWRGWPRQRQECGDEEQRTWRREVRARAQSGEQEPRHHDHGSNKRRQPRRLPLGGQGQHGCDCKHWDACQRPGESTCVTPRDDRNHRGDHESCRTREHARCSGNPRPSRHVSKAATCPRHRPRVRDDPSGSCRCPLGRADERPVGPATPRPLNSDPTLLRPLGRAQLHPDLHRTTEDIPRTRVVIDANSRRSSHRGRDAAAGRRTWAAPPDDRRSACGGKGRRRPQWRRHSAAWA